MTSNPREIVEFIKNYVWNNGFTSVVIGNSGGIDSAVTMSLCVDALGKENVKALWLPCGLDSSVDDAMLMKEFLDVQMNILDITNAYDEIVRSTILSPAGDVLQKLYREGDKEAINQMIRHGNIKARLRMTMLYDHAAMNGSLVVGTSNATELVTGYFTKWGDGAADFLPLARCYKKDVRVIAEKIGIPRRIIDKPPSADLWEGQTDEEELQFTYAELDEILPDIVAILSTGTLCIDMGLSDDRMKILNKYGVERIKGLENRIRVNRHKILIMPDPHTYTRRRKKK